MHKRLEHMKETLMCAVEMQLCDLGEVDTKELGEAIDMIKDLEEAIYYCTVTEAMNNPKHEFEFEMNKNGHEEHMYSDGSRSYMYADSGRNRRADGTFYMDNGRNYMDTMYSEDMNGTTHRDMREGRSYNNRRMYMEAKEMKKDKSVQLRELEKYMQELSTDITEMIADASMEEKQYLEKKISALATKIAQMK